MRIIFLGTPAFAVASLDALIKSGHDVAAVVTAPDKPAGRGMQLQYSAIKDYAVANNLPVLQPEKLKNPGFIEQLRSYNAEVQAVVAFRMLPEMVWNMPPQGTINVHASLLPQYRGAAPINWAIINGETETGVTTFRLQQEIDTGNILMQDRVAILPEDNAGSLHDKLMDAGARLLVCTLEGIEAGTLKGYPQPVSAEMKSAPKIFKEDTKIDWQQTAVNVHNLVRGLSPYPAAYTMLQDKTLKIFSTRYELAKHGAAPGSHDTDGVSWLRFAAADGWIYVDELQLEGKKRMDTTSFLRGYRG
jgi:methionyl-tRNA formyltransferase